MSQEDEKRMLHEICRNSKMGVSAIDQVLEKVYDEELAYELHVEADRMREFERKANQRLKSCGDEPEEINPVAEAMLRSSIRMKTLFRDGKDHIADMVQKGNRRGAQELKNAIHKYKGAGIYATELAKEMIDFEEENLKKLSVYKK